MLRRLATIHGRFPESMIITEEIKVSDRIHYAGRFADIRTGTYTEDLVAVKIMRVAEHDNPPEMKKVSIDDMFRSVWM